MREMKNTNLFNSQEASPDKYGNDFFFTGRVSCRKEKEVQAEMRDD